VRSPVVHIDNNKPRRRFTDLNKSAFMAFRFAVRQGHHETSDVLNQGLLRETDLKAHHGSCNIPEVVHNSHPRVATSATIKSTKSKTRKGEVIFHLADACVDEALLVRPELNLPCFQILLDSTTIFLEKKKTVKSSSRSCLV
jgi:hypothetical protein